MTGGLTVPISSGQHLAERPMVRRTLANGAALAPVDGAAPPTRLGVNLAFDAMQAVRVDGANVLTPPQGRQRNSQQRRSLSVGTRHRGCAATGSRVETYR